MHFSVLHDPAPTEIYTLSLHDALPIYIRLAQFAAQPSPPVFRLGALDDRSRLGQVDTPTRAHENKQHDCAASSPSQKTDRKSTRLNSSHQIISYAVFCLKKKKKQIKKQ